MIEVRALTGRLQERRRLLALAPVAHIDYSAALDTPANAQQLPELVIGAADDITEVGSFEAALKQSKAMLHRLAGTLRRQDGLRPREPALDVLRHAGRGGGCKCDHRCGHPLPQAADQQIVRSEVIPPLRDAVGLVHHDETDVQHVKIGTEKRGIETFWRNVQELESSVSSVVECNVHFAPVHPRVDAQCPDATGVEVLYLVLHKGDQRSDHQCEALAHEGRDLEAHGLAASRREDGKHVPAFQRGPDDLSLHGSERVISPVFP